MSELNNVNEPHNDNDDYDEESYHIFEVIETETRVYHQGVCIPSHIKGKDAIEAYMQRASEAGDEWNEGYNPHSRLWEYILDTFTQPVEYRGGTSSIKYLRTED
jgi:hypothetical protein